MADALGNGDVISCPQRLESFQSIVRRLIHPGVKLRYQYEVDEVVVTGGQSGIHQTAPVVGARKHRFPRLR